jgi:purine-binding chemotaxis protein CheW
MKSLTDVAQYCTFWIDDLFFGVDVDDVLRFRLGLPPRADDRLPMNVIVRSRGEVVSLLVDDIGDVVDTDGLTLEQIPSNMPAEVQQVVHAVRPLPERLLLVLDSDRAVEVPSAEPAGATA